MELTNALHLDHSGQEPTERDKELVREAKRRARAANQSSGNIRADLEHRPSTVQEGVETSDGGPVIVASRAVEDSVTTVEAEDVGVIFQRLSFSEPKQVTFEEFCPPRNFSMVHTGIYRSGYPVEASYGYLKRIGIKSIITLVPDPLPASYTTFIYSAAIRHFHIGMPGNKEPFVNIPLERVVAALKVLLDRRNHPLLVHCNKGKHRTGCVVGCFRKIQHWAFAKIVEEYRDHSDPKSRNLDEQFIDLFDESGFVPVARRRGFVLGGR